MSHLADNSRGNAPRNLRLLALTIAIMSLPLTTGCWVQSVYPFYEESDVVVDPGLVGNWEGDSDLKSCLLKIGLDPATRTYTIEVANSGDIKTGAPCQAATFEGKLVQIGVQRFLDVAPDQEKCWAAPLDSLMKVETDKQKLVLTPLDPDWMASAMDLPFALKLMEGLLDQVPQHRGLLFATSSGFTQYSYVWVQQPADEVEQQDVERAKIMRLRARKLYLRARDYGIRGLEVKHRGFGAELRRDPKAAVRVARKKDVPLLYWTAASWGAAISVSKDDPELVADQPIVEALINRSLQLDAEFDHGAIHGFLISYESARQGAKGDFAVRSRQHFERQVELTEGSLASPFVALAEAVSVSKQERSEFESLLKRALAIDPNTKPEWRLNNVVMQRRARWLLSREDDLFLSEKPEVQNAADN